MPIPRGRRAAAALAAAAGSAVLAATAYGLPPFTTTPKTAPGSGGQVEVTGMAAACHADFDRLVLRGRLGTPEYDARRVRRIRQDGSGNLVRLRGTGRIKLLLRNARAHTQAGAPTLPQVRTPRCPALRQVKLASDFEGVVTIGLGVRGRPAFRVFRLTGPTRVVVDVAH